MSLCFGDDDDEDDEDEIKRKSRAIVCNTHLITNHRYQFSIEIIHDLPTRPLIHLTLETSEGS